MIGRAFPVIIRSFIAASTVVIASANLNCGGQACKQKSCADLGASCGQVSNGCGGTIECGSCAAPMVCGGGGTANVCGTGPCVPQACGARCGQISDGCGGTIECGSCAAPMVCGGSGTANVCGTGPCVPQACGTRCGQVSDGCGAMLECGGCTAPETCGGGSKPNQCSIADPVGLASPIDPTVTTDIATSTAFLYRGDYPIQLGVANGTIEARRVAIIRGVVEDRDGGPIAGVRVTVLGHPEFGFTLTRTDGMFDLAVNGGGFLTVNYQKAGLLPSQRQVQTPWRDFVWAPKVTLVPLTRMSPRWT